MASRRWMCGFLLCCGVQAGGAQAADLMAVVELALDHDAELAQARAGYQAAQQALPKARAALLPRIDGGWGRGYNRIASDGMSSSIGYWQSGWTVTLSQPLFDWTRWTTYQQADLIAARGGVEWANARQESILRAARAYFDLLAAEDERRRAIDYLTRIDAQIDLVERKRAAGEATLIDLREAQGLRAQALLQRMDAESELQSRQRAMEVTTGQPSAWFSPLWRLSGRAIGPELAAADAESWALQARTQGYPVQLRQIESQIASLDVSKSRGAHYPALSLSASYLPASASAGADRPTTTTTAMLMLSVPLFAGGETQARLKETMALEDKAQSGLLSASRTAEAAARDSFSAFQWGMGRVDQLAEGVKASEAVVEATQIGYRVGERTSLELLRAFDSLYLSQRDLLRARYQTLVSLLQLKAAAGTLNVDAVAQINGMLNALVVPARAAPVMIQLLE